MDSENKTSSSLSPNYRCRLCGKHFDTFGELVKHVQEGDFDGGNDQPDKE